MKRGDYKNKSEINKNKINIRDNFTGLQLIQLLIIEKSRVYRSASICICNRKEKRIAKI